MNYKGNIISFISVKEEHFPLMVRWRNDPFISKMMFSRSRFTVKRQIEWFQKSKREKSRVQFIIRDNRTKNLIGSIYLMNIDKKNAHCDWGYYIGEESFRMGGHAIEAEYLILKYAFHKLSLNKVYCQTFSHNNKVIAIHRKFGFVTEGVLREHYKTDDGYADVVIMSILKDEFEKSSEQIRTLLNIFSR